MRSVTFRQLRVFVEVARHLSFARAAEHLHLTPPAVTMQVRELENHVGLPLFDRSGRTVALTTAGEYFLVYARRMLATLREAENAMARFKRLETGRITVGMIGTAKYFVPHLMMRFGREHPGVEVQLRIGANREQLVQMLHHDEVDLAVMGRPPRELATRAEAFGAHPLVFVCPPEHALLGHGQASVQDLAPWPVLVRERASGTRDAFESYCREQRFEPASRIELPSTETIKQAVMAGMGISLISLHTVGLELTTGRLRLLPVVGTPLMRTWNVVHLLSRSLSPPAEAFRYFLLEHGEQFLVEHDTPLLGPPPGVSGTPH